MQTPAIAPAAAMLQTALSQTATSAGEAAHALRHTPSVSAHRAGRARPDGWKAKARAKGKAQRQARKTTRR